MFLPRRENATNLRISLTEETDPQRTELIRNYCARGSIHALALESLIIRYWIYYYIAFNILLEYITFFR